MVSVIQPARALVDPADGVRVAVGNRRWVWPLLIWMACNAFSGIAFAVRWDATPAVIAQLTEAGELTNTTEKELQDKIQTQSRVVLVAGAAKAVFGLPVMLLLGTVLLKFSGWLFGRSIKFVSALSALAVAMLPIALYHLCFGVVALSSAELSMDQVATLIPSHLGHLLSGLSPQMARLASVVDVFNLWATVLLGFGIAEGAGIARWKGFVWALGLYLAYAGVFLIGVPALAGGPGGGR